MIAEENRRKKTSEEFFWHITEWETKHWREVEAMAEAKRAVRSKQVAELIRRGERSARRIAQHSKRQRNREKVKIPAPPGDEDGSSVTYYTSSTEISDTDSADSIPEILQPET